MGFYGTGLLKNDIWGLKKSIFAENDRLALFGAYVTLNRILSHYYVISWYSTWGFTIIIRDLLGCYV